MCPKWLWTSIQIFEGNADCVTMYAGGVRTSTALCGTAFTEKHLELILSAGINKILLVMDPDDAGERATSRFISTLEQFGGRPGLTVEIVVMPKGTGDPDAYVRAFGPNLKVGVSEFRKLTRTDLFTWGLKKQIEEGADATDIAKSTMGLIVNLPNNLDRLRQVEQLAAATGLPSEFLQRELWRLVDSNEMLAEEQKTIVVNETIKNLQRNPGSAESILAAAHMRLEEVENSRNGFDPKLISDLYRISIEKMEAAVSIDELVTGDPIFDGLMGGIPKEAVNISMPGGPHHGKSIEIDNLIVKVLRRNPDAQIMLHHVDDAAMLRLPRILGVMSGLSSRKIAKAGASFLEPGGDEFEERFRKADEEISLWIAEERLILADLSILSGTLPAHERWIKEIRRRSPKRHFVSIGDNFHLFDMPGVEDGEAKLRAMSKYVSSIATRNGVTTIFTMELPKDSLKPGVRPKYTDSKGTGGIAFDSKVNINIFQELQSLGDEATLTWSSPDFMQEVIDPNGHTTMSNTPLPIVEVIVDKNKVTGVKRTVFYRLERQSGRMEECSREEQQVMSARRSASTQDDRRQHRGGKRWSRDKAIQEYFNEQ
jgi:Toprim-like